MRDAVGIDKDFDAEGAAERVEAALRRSKKEPIKKIKMPIHARCTGRRVAHKEKIGAEQNEEKQDGFFTGKEKGAKEIRRKQRAAQSGIQRSQGGG